MTKKIKEITKAAFMTNDKNEYYDLIMARFAMIRKQERDKRKFIIVECVNFGKVVDKDCISIYEMNNINKNMPKDCYFRAV